MQYIEYSIEGGIGILKFNNPAALNALNTECLKELKGLISDLFSDKSLRVLIITGSGKAFVAGADIKQMNSLTTYQAKEFSELGNSIFSMIENFPVPVISAINGFALGGGLELLLSTDFAYASENAKFGMPELKLGLIPGFGGCKRLTDRIGLQSTKELIYTGKMIDAREALSIGLIARVTPHDELMAEALKTAKEIAALRPNAVVEVKELLNSCQNNSFDVVSEIEKNKFGLIFSNNEAREGMLDFINRPKK